jgi:hypothetical protein
LSFSDISFQPEFSYFHYQLSAFSFLSSFFLSSRYFATLFSPRH